MRDFVDPDDYSRPVERKPYTVLDFVSDQIKAANPDVDWQIQGINRAGELARLFVEHGVTDLGALTLLRIDVTHQQHAWSVPEPQSFYVFDFNGRRIGYLSDNDQYLRNDNGAIKVAWSAAGHGQVHYYLISRNGGFAFMPIWASSSDIGTIRDFLTTSFLLSSAIIFPAAGISAGQSLGSAILGPSISASSPALAAVVGNTALTAAFNGGDIENAVKTAVTGQVAGMIGADVGAATLKATDVELLGKISAAGTAAFVQGKDVDNAVALTLAYNAGDVVTIFDRKDTAMGDLTFENYGSFDAYPEIGTYAPAGFQFDLSTVDPISLTSPDLVNANVSLSIPTAIPLPVPEAPKLDEKPIDWKNVRDVVNSVSQMTISALSTVRAFRQANSPTVVTSAQTVTGAGIVRALDSGVVQTQTADGRVTVARPPVGVAQSTVSGNVIVNNGDGTYTLVRPDGTRSVKSYGAGSGSGSDLSSLPWGVILGGVGALFALFR